MKTEIANFTTAPWVAYNADGLYCVRSTATGHRVANDLLAGDARLIAACPIMYEYISKKAGEGDAEAQSIVATL